MTSKSVSSASTSGDVFAWTAPTITVSAPDLRRRPSSNMRNDLPTPESSLKKIFRRPVSGLLFAFQVTEKLFGIGPAGSGGAWHYLLADFSGNCLSRARFASSTFTRGSPRKPSSRASVTLAIACRPDPPKRRAPLRYGLPERGGCRADMGIETAGRGGGGVGW